MNSTNEVKVVLTTQPENLLDVSDEVFEALDIAINCIVVHLLSSLGLIGNSLNIAVLSQHSMRDTTNLILLCLSVSDLCFSCFMEIYYINKIVYYFDQYLSMTMWTYISVLTVPVQTLLFFTSTSLVMILSVERMVAVCFPFHVSRIVTRFRIKFLIGVFIFGLAGVVSPLYGARTLETVTFNNVTIVSGVSTEFFTNAYFSAFYMFLTIYLLVFITSVVIVCTIITLASLTVSSSKIQHLSAEVMLKRAREVRSARTSLCLSSSLIFLVLVPSGLFDIIFASNNSLFRFTNKALMVLNTFKQILYLFNSSFNLVLYVITSPKFAQTFRNIFRVRTGLRYSNIQKISEKIIRSL
ncbi:G-protein coupled receptor 39 [Biomphalaria glabrata]|nr:G-protein coupled receptor 39-like [Biomphalaria glabrata]